MGSRKGNSSPPLGAFVIVTIVVLLFYFGLPRMPVSPSADFNIKPYNDNVFIDPVSGELLITAYVKPNRTLVNCKAQCKVYAANNKLQRTITHDIGRVAGSKEQQLTFVVDTSSFPAESIHYEISFSGTAVSILPPVPYLDPQT